MASITDEHTFLGMDVHKSSITIGTLRPGQDAPDVERIGHDEVLIRRFVARFPQPDRLRVCYEAGPTGYELARLLASMGVSCQVIAPSLIPTAPGDRVKTDRRDCRRLARLYRAGELTAIRIPTAQEEGVRDLCRARADMVIDRTRARHRLGKFLLRHGRIWRGGEAWTLKHEQWMAAQRFEDPAVQSTLEHYRATVQFRQQAVEAIDADLEPWCNTPPFGDLVSRLSAYRGIAALGALSIVSEVADFRRFPAARAFMGFTGLVPSEYSSGERTVRGHITHAGNQHVRTQLIESAWSYKHRPGVGRALRVRQQGLPAEVIARAWKAQQRLCGRFRRLDARKAHRNVVVTAIARELAGFVWAEGIA